MHFHRIRKIAESFDHVSHQITLALIATAVLAELLSERIPAARGAEHALAEALHVLHYVILAVAIAYLVLRALLSRNVAHELARTLDAVPRFPITVLFPDGIPYKYLRLPMTDADVCVVDGTDAALVDQLNALNEQGFAGSAFEISAAMVRERNAAWRRKNPRMYLLVREAGTSAPARSFIGYSCVVPLTDVGEDVYMRGLIHDRDLPESLICAPGEPSACLLIFAVVLEEQRRVGHPGAHAQLNRLLKGVEYHISLLAAQHGHHPRGTRVWTQTEHPSISKHLENLGFKATVPPTVSADKFELMFKNLTVTGTSN